MLARLGLYKGAAPVPPPKAIAASFKKAPELAKKTPPPVPPKAKKDFNDVQRTMGFSKNSAEAIKEAAFNAGYYDALSMLKVAFKAPLSILKKGPAALAGPKMMPQNLAKATYEAPNVAAALPGASSASQASFGQGIAQKPGKPPAGASTRNAVRNVESAAAKSTQRGENIAAPSKIDPSKAPLLRQGGASRAPKPPPGAATPPPTPPPNVKPVGSAAAAPPATPGAATPPAGPGFGQTVKDTWGKMPGWGKGLSIGGAAGLGGMGIGAAMQPDVNVYR
jgi:hypothetical protein